MRTSNIFRLQYCFSSKVSGYYKSDKYCQMPESYGFGLLFSKVGCAKICDCYFVEQLLTSLPDLIARDFCILLMKIFQLKLEHISLLDLNKCKCGTIPSGKKSCMCLLVLY